MSGLNVLSTLGSQMCHTSHPALTVRALLKRQSPPTGVSVAASVSKSVAGDVPIPRGLVGVTGCGEG